MGDARLDVASMREPRLCNRLLPLPRAPTPRPLEVEKHQDAFTRPSTPPCSPPFALPRRPLLRGRPPWTGSAAP
jgi:hypothetical protein